MSNYPLPSVTSSEPCSDIFERLLQCKHLLTAQELATMLHLSPKTLYSYAERNLIPHFKIETNVRFHGGKVANWLRSRGFRTGHPLWIARRRCWWGVTWSCPSPSQRSRG